LTRRDDRLLGGALLGLLLLASILGAWHLSAPRRGTHLLVGSNPDLGVVFARLGTGNTGLLRTQAVTRVVVMTPGAAPIEHRAVHPEAQVGPAGIVAGSDRLVATADGWELRVAGEGLNARLLVGGQRDGGCPPPSGALGGMVQDPAEGRLFDGTGLVSRTERTGNTGDNALYVVGAGFAAGIDPQATCPTWVRAGERTWSDARAVAFHGERGESMRLGDWTLVLRGLDAPVSLDAHAHALPLERAIAALIGFPSPRAALHRVTVEVHGPGVDGVRPGVALLRALDASMR
jgi:hypothetical protein